MTPIDQNELKALIRAIGMKAYVEFLFPAMIRNREISIEELCQEYPEFSTYTQKAQSTRRSKARKIFDNGWQFAGLKTISLSSRTAPDVRAKAQELELKYI